MYSVVVPVVVRTSNSKDHQADLDRSVLKRLAKEKYDGRINKAFLPEVEYIPPGVVPEEPVITSKEIRNPRDQEKMDMAEVVQTIRQTRKALSLWKALKVYSEKSSVIGLSYIADTNSKTSRKFCWLSLLIFGLIMLTIQLWVGVEHLMSRPILSVVKVVYEPSLEFPAVTICNFNMFRKSYINGLGHDYVDYIHKLHSGEHGVSFDKVNHINMTAFYLAAGHQKKDMVKLCEWQGQQCSADDFESSLTDFGLCHTFNSALNTPKVVYNKGARFGLRLQLDLEVDEYMVGPRTSVGFKVLLHHQLDIPRGLANDLGFVVGPGTYNVAEVHVSKIYNLEAPFGDCGNRTLDHVTPYSIMGCYLDCQTTFITENCKCKDAFMPGDFPVCSPSQEYVCSKPMMDEYVEQVDRHCSCPVPCTRHLYVPRVSSSAFPAPPYYETHIQRQYNMSSEDFAKRSLLELVTYFEDLKFTETTQKAAYKWYNLLADIGGSMGIFLGISILSVFEFIDYMFRHFHASTE
ncbi:acid-sensing ion channel 1A-like [Anneissia japonica]|uniref:acid-sensing ion channel 1A-like n=1 Tax=Anneissia japonica TaxID=1529436 RepID=UPI00142578AA|nr:acid-sensing ion channel 1A-like [Anneissia japonica]